MTIPMLMLLFVVIVATIAAVWALVREHRERSRTRRFSEVWEARAFSAKQSRPEMIDERARMSAMSVRPLPDNARVQFRAAILRTRMRFVDEPSRALGEADRLVSEIMHARGVPAWTLEHDQATPLAWRHPELEEKYRIAKRITTANGRGDASREEIRQAFASYNAICDRLLDEW